MASLRRIPGEKARRFPGPFALDQGDPVKTFVEINNNLRKQQTQDLHVAAETCIHKRRSFVFPAQIYRGAGVQQRPNDIRMTSLHGQRRRAARARQAIPDDAFLRSREAASECRIVSAVHTPAYVIKVSAEQDATFTVMNTRKQLQQDL
jgi:hypothetical protein